MKNLLSAGAAVLEDLASTILFFVLYTLTGSIAVSVAAAILLAIGQIGWRLARHQKPDALQWISLFLVAASGTATLANHNPIFVMLKPSVIYLLVGFAMLQKGWMVRYMPPVAMEYVGDMAIGFGYVWAGLMFLSAIINLVLALHYSVLVWGTAMSIWGTGSKVILFLAQYGMMRVVGRKRRLARSDLSTGHTRGELAKA
jgi:intracellular septation protein A